MLALHAAFITIHSSDTTYAYDANGTLTSGGGRSYAWNADNLPLSITGADGVSESYAYDAEGARVKQTRGSATPPSIGGLLEISGSVTKSSYSFSGQTIAVRDSSAGVSYLHGDHLDNVALSVSGTRATTSAQEFDPWDQVRSGGISQTSLNDTGQRLDETGLLYYHARMYDPALARFVSADSIVPGVGALTLWPSDETAEKLWKQGGKTQDGKPNAPKNPQELNRYSYVSNNPLNQRDPTGHCGGSVWQNLKSVFNGSCLRKAVAIWKSPRKSRSANLLASTYIGLSAVGLVYGSVAAGKLVWAGYGLVASIAGPVAPELGRKLDFMLGKATGSQHNGDRSQSMLSQLQRIGLNDTPATRNYLIQHFFKVLNDSSNIARVQENGRVVRESLLMGPNGAVKIESI